MNTDDRIRLKELERKAFEQKVRLGRGDCRWLITKLKEKESVK